MSATRHHPSVPPLDQGAGALLGRVPRSQAPHAHRRAAQRVRGGAVPEHLRLLGAANRDLPAPGRRLHAHVRLLRHRDGKAPPSSIPMSRVAWPSRSGSLGLRHAVITSVNRDDLPDGGAHHFHEVVRILREIHPACGVEVLIPDFLGNDRALDHVLDARPDILNHNVETVPSLYALVRRGAKYDRSLRLLAHAKSLRAVHPRQVGHHGGPRRVPRRGARDDAPTSARRASTSSPSASTCSPRRSTCRCGVSGRPRSSPRSRARASPWVTVTSRAVRSCDRATTPTSRSAGSGPPRRGASSHPAYRRRFPLNPGEPGSIEIPL